MDPSNSFCWQRTSYLSCTLSPTVSLGASLPQLLELLQSVPQQLHLLVAVSVLLPQMLVLFFQLLQLVCHPVFDSSRLGLHLLSVSQPLLSL